MQARGSAAERKDGQWRAEDGLRTSVGRCAAQLGVVSESGCSGGEYPAALASPLSSRLVFPALTLSSGLRLDVPQA